MIFSITDYDAKSGTDELQTIKIQATIDACAKAGGGTVLVPAGIYRTSTLRLRSNITLHLENGAVLHGPDNFDDYIKLPFKWDLYPYTISLIYAINERNIRICGEGTINFNGISFANTEHVCVNENIPKELQGDAHYEMSPRDKRPNRLVFFQSCEDIEVYGVTFIDSPTWTLVFHDCSILRLHDFRVKNDRRIPNNDGIHCCGCKDVIITGCIFNCGDDCIAITSISDESLINERFVISDCIFQSASAAFRLGFQGGKLRNILIKNCIIHGSNRGISIFAGKGGFVENISIDGLHIETKLYAGYWWGKGEPMVICSSEDNSTIRNITLRNTTIKSENGIIISGVNGSVSDITLENLNMELGYGIRRPWTGDKIDLSPNPNKPAPDAKHAIPWLWTDGKSKIHSQKIQVRKKDGESVDFDTEKITLL